MRKITFNIQLNPEEDLDVSQLHCPAYDLKCEFIKDNCKYTLLTAKPLAKSRIKSPLFSVRSYR